MNSIVYLCIFVIIGATATDKKEDDTVKAIAVLKGDKATGTVLFSQNCHGGAVTVQVHIDGLAPNSKFGFHIHEKGDLTQGCTTFGGHYNPEGAKHGGPNATVRHNGDLGNVESDINGQANVTFTDPIISLVGSRSIFGRGVVLHEGVDDLGLGDAADSHTTGHAGGRQACGVIGILHKPESSLGLRLGTPISLLALTLLIL